MTPWPPVGIVIPPPSRYPCPYRLCSGIVYLRYDAPPPWIPQDSVDRKSHWMVPLHQISNALLKGNCPASLMRIPYFREHEWDDGTIRALQEAYERDAHRIPGLIGQADKERERALFWRTKPRPDSFSARGPHRMGREPSPEAIDDWQLGGREDEDSGKLKPPIHIPSIPDYIQGQEVGRHVATIPEIIGVIHTAAAKTGESIAALQYQQNQLDQVRGGLNEAHSLIGALQGEMNVQLLQEYLAIIEQEQNNVEQLAVLMEGMMQSIQVGQEKGEEMIGRMVG